MERTTSVTITARRVRDSTNAALTALGDVDGDADVDVEVLGLHSVEHRPTRQQRHRVVKAVCLRVRVQAVLQVNGHLTVALMPVGRRAQEVLLALGTLDTHPPTSTSPTASVCQSVCSHRSGQRRCKCESQRPAGVGRELREHRVSQDVVQHDANVTVLTTRSSVCCTTRTTQCSACC